MNYIAHNNLNSSTHSTEIIAGFFKWSLVILLLLLPGGPILVTLLAVAIGSIGKVKKVDLFFLFFLTGFINGSLANFEGYSMLRYLILLPLLINARSKILAGKVLTTPVLVFFFYLVGHSLLISPNPMFSFLNVVSAFLTIAVGFAAIYCDRKEGFWLEFQTICMVIALWSLISIPFTEFSYARNGVGLQGIGTHPNLFGIFLAPLCFYAFTQLLSRPRFFDILLFIVFFMILILSQSRTSIFAVILSLLFYAVFADKMITKYAKRGIILFLPMVAILIAFAGPISNTVIDILTKGGGETITVTDSIERSRGALFFAQIENIEAQPFLGIGFKIMSSGESNSFFEAASADNTYEKGVFLLALTEELGIIGALLFAVVLYSMLAHIFNRKVQSAVFFIPICFLFTTFGEATLFSIGGNGSLIWASIALSNYKYKVG